MRIQLTPKAAAIGEVGVRRDHQPAGPRLEPRDVVQRASRLDESGREVEQEHVPAVDGAFDARNERDAAFAREGGHPRIGELAIVQGDGERVEAERRRAVDQVRCAVGNPVDRVFAGVKMKVYFQHVG